MESQAAIEANITMLSAVTEICAEKTLGSKHNSAQITPAESTAYKNCIAKFMVVPQFIMTAVQGIQ